MVVVLLCIPVNGGLYCVPNENPGSGGAGSNGGESPNPPGDTGSSGGSGGGAGLTGDDGSGGGTCGTGGSCPANPCSTMSWLCRPLQMAMNQDAQPGPGNTRQWLTTSGQCGPEMGIGSFCLNLAVTGDDNGEGEPGSGATADSGLGDLARELLSRVGARGSRMSRMW